MGTGADGTPGKCMSQESVFSGSWTAQCQGDCVLRIEFASRDQLMAFARAVQECSVLDAEAMPEPGPMQGYDAEVLMAGGTLVQGSTVELSFDAPMRQPYVGYLQGGLNAWQMVQATARGIIYSRNT